MLLSSYVDLAHRGSQNTPIASALNKYLSDSGGTLGGHWQVSWFLFLAEEEIVS